MQRMALCLQAVAVAGGACACAAERGEALVIVLRGGSGAPSGCGGCGGGGEADAAPAAPAAAGDASVSGDAS
jgi:hypothetical protein